MTNSNNNYRNKYLVFETLVVFILVSLLAVIIQKLPVPVYVRWIVYTPLLIFQGLWFYRFYIVGHEASHRKLFMDNATKNDIWGSIILLPLMTPINIYRKIHLFHHGFNRKDHHTSALDTYVTKKESRLKKIYYYAIWYISIFCGGFFIHSLASVVLFLFIPPVVSVKISPAFIGWTVKDQVKAIGLFSIGLGLHLGVYFLLGKDIYLAVLGYPMLAFAWILSLLVYIFHYDTTIGHEVRFNVRSVNRVPVISWVLMNFNEHATHHQYPNIPWYELPKKRKPLPDTYDDKNQSTRNFFKAILNQLKGPTIVYEETHS